MSTSSTLTFPNTLTNNTTADADQVMADFNAVSTLINSTGLGTNNIKDDTITGAKMDSSVADDSTLEYASSSIRIKDGGVTAAKLASDSVTTAKIVDAAVTRAKLASVGQQVSSSSSLSTSSSAYTDVTNATVTITTTGRPVWVGMMSDGTEVAYLRLTTSNSDVSTARFKLLRDSTALSYQEMSVEAASVSGVSLNIPVSSIWHLDTPSAGTYTYKLQEMNTANTSQHQTSVIKGKLVAFEL